MQPATRRRAPHAVALSLVFAPLALTALRAVSVGLGANPIEALTHVTGEWSLRTLLLALAVTPLRRLTGLSWLAPLRRTLGLAAFAWVSLHLATWVALDQFFDASAMLEDVLERRFITVGMAGFLCLLPLAITSTRAWQRRLGARWVRLHRLAYVAAACGVLHYTWLVKGEQLAPIAYGAVLLALLALRLRGGAVRALRRGGS